MSVERIAGTSTSPGYSGKPPWQKLGLMPGLRVWLRHAPADYWALCGFEPASVAILPANTRRYDFGHLFASRRTVLERDLPAAARKLGVGGMLWISWPKKSSGVASDVSEGTLREIALPLGLVDVKVCALTQIWSGLKFVWRRPQAAVSSSRKQKLQMKEGQA
ncbi:MAG: DUF3052 domain-containing protein [Rudaea sp.]|nr:DUF3052 domain-containing protein [Rudaea sp.]